MTDLINEILSLDCTFRRERRCGPIVVEIHYKDGVPMNAKIRDWLNPPPLRSLSLTAST